MSANWLTTASNTPSSNGSAAVPRDPIDVRSHTFRDREHPVVEVEPDHSARAAHALPSAPGEHTGSTPGVQHHVAIGDGRGVEDMLHPLHEQRRHQRGLVHGRRRPTDLPTLGLRHDGTISRRRGADKRQAVCDSTPATEQDSYELQRLLPLSGVVLLVVAVAG